MMPTKWQTWNSKTKNASTYSSYLLSSEEVTNISASLELYSKALSHHGDLHLNIT